MSNNRKADNGVFLVLCSFLCDDAVVWDQGNDVTKSSCVSNIQFIRTELRRGWFELSFACMLTCSQVIKQTSLSSLLLLHRHCSASPATSFSSSAFTKKCDFEPFILIVHFIVKIGVFENCICLLIYEGWDMVYVWRSEDNIQELVVSFCHVGPGDWTHVRLSSKCLNLLSHLVNPL